MTAGTVGTVGAVRLVAAGGSVGSASRAPRATRTSAPVTARTRPPSLRVEKRLLRDGHVLLGACDEVGRGALGGPVTVGIVLVDATVQRPLSGVRDSKLLTPQARVALVPRIRRWVVGHAVGHASAVEIDEIGIIAALRLAGWRALAQLPARPDLVLLDGNHDWLSRPRQPTLFDDTPLADAEPPRVRTMIKADLQCSSVAAASVLAKTERDAIMVRLAVDHPGYGWDENKGYSTSAHMEALRRLGPSVHHRQSWRLPETRDPESEGLFPAPDATVPVRLGGREALERCEGAGEADPHGVGVAAGAGVGTDGPDGGLGDDLDADLHDGLDALAAPPTLAR